MTEEQIIEAMAIAALGVPKSLQEAHNHRNLTPMFERAFEAVNRASPYIKAV
jgi:hypothetical protein